jgi:hypothetical protein
LGFLWLERSSVAFLGVGEYSLRLIPLLCGLASLPLSWYAAKKFLSESGALLVTSVVAFSSCAVFFSNAAKPYGIDLFVTLVLLLVAGGRSRPWNWALTGTLALFFSMPSVFILAGIWVQEAISAFRRRASGGFWIGWMLVGACWAAFFWLLFLLVYAPVANDHYMKHYWAPTSFQAQANLAAIIKLILSATLGGAFGLNVGSGLPADGGTFPGLFFAVTALLFVLGLFRAPLALSISFFFTLIAAALGKWVFSERLMLFYVPAAALAIACAMDWLFRFPPLGTRAKPAAPLRQINSLLGRWGRHSAPAFYLAVILLLAVLPARYCFWIARHPEREALRESVEFVIDETPASGSVYCYYKSAPAWLFYTTDWRTPDTARVRWMFDAMESPADNRRPGEPLESSPQSQWISAARPWRGGWEFIGAPDGISISARGREETAPSDGWVNNQYELVRSHAVTEIAFLGIASGARGLPDLERRFRADGAAIFQVNEGRNPELEAAHVAFFKMPAVPAK